MQISSEKVSLLIDLIDIIALKLGYKIGYTHPMGSFTSEKDDFIILDTMPAENYEIVGLAPENIQEKPMLVAKEDFERHQVGICVIEKSKSFCLHDDRVASFLKEVDDALLSGILFFDPYIKEQIGNQKFTIRKKVNGQFEVMIDLEDRQISSTRTFEQLIELSEYDSKYLKVVELIRKQKDWL